METAGLARPSRSGSLIDRFRRRLLWPIRDVSGDVIGFGARKIFDDDDGPKYLNTPESPLYKKSHVLYGVDMAKRDIAKQGRAVIVEGYTDVMACHLAGVTTAVATCGTAFGNDHISVLRRLLLDTDTYGGEIIFTFDGDAAGQKAALRAFADDQRFVGQTFIAVSPDNMDPCELRLAKGDLAVRDLVASREPLIAFSLRSTLLRFDLDTVEGRVGALRATAPMVAKIKDKSLLSGYSQRLAGDLGLEVEEVRRAVQSAAGGPAAPQQRAQPIVSNPRLLVEREALKLAVQSPVLAGPVFDAVDQSFYSDPAHQAIRSAIAEVGGAVAGVSGAGWINTIRDACPDLAVQMLVMELAVDPVRYDGEPDSAYLNIVLARLQLAGLKQRIDEVKSKLQRINPVSDKEEYHRRFSDLLALEQHSRALKEQAAGGL
jgi:DNA primase